MPHDPGSRFAILVIVVEHPGVAEKIDDVEDAGDGREKEDRRVIVGGKDEDCRENHRHRRADLAPRARVAVHPGAFMLASLVAQPGEDHRLVGSRAERLPDGEEEHREKEHPDCCRETEDNEAARIADERQDHCLASPEKIGNRPRGNLKGVDDDFAEGDEESDDEKAQPLFHQREIQERLEVALILQETIEGESKKHERGTWHWGEGRMAWREYLNVGSPTRLSSESLPRDRSSRRIRKDRR